MAIGLHVNLKKKLVADLSAIIPNLRVVKGISVTHDTRDLLLTLDQSLPGHGDIRDKLSAWISDRPISDFIVGSINFEMMQCEFAAESVPLTEIEGWDDPDSQAKRLVDELDALPNTYVVTTPAPDGMAPYLVANKGNITLAKKLRFAVSDEEFEKTYPVSTGNQKLDDEIWNIGILNLMGDGPRYEWKGAYTQLVVRGYIGRFTDTNTEHNIVGDFKALWGATLALQITQRRRTWSQFSPKKKLIVHVQKADGLTLVPRIELDAQTSQLVEDIKFNDWAPDDHTTEAKAGMYSIYIKNLESLFSEGDESSRLRLGSGPIDLM